MKYLEIPELGLLASMLSDSSHSVRTMTRLEAYSCKSVASERKLMKSLDQEFASDLEISTSSSSPEALSSSNALESAFGRLDRKDCRKTFWLLIATLNAAYPDHNFSRVKVEDFQAESPQAVLTKLSEALERDRSGANFASTLGALSTSPEYIPKKNFSSPEDSQPPNNSSLTAIHPLIRQVLDPVIDLSHCEIYSYCPDADSDPHAVVSDDEEDVESVASSIYGSPRHDLLQHSYSTDLAEETMWEIEGIDHPTYSQPTTHPVRLAFGTSNLPTQTISTPSSPLPNQATHPTQFSKPSQKPTRPNSELHQSFKAHSDLQTPLLSPLSSSGESSYEEESAGGLLWSSHYFFYNRKMKRILFVSTWVRKALIPSTTINESTASHSTHEPVDYLFTSHLNRPSTTMADTDAVWDHPSQLVLPTPDNPHRRDSNNLPKRRDSVQKKSAQSAKRAVDRSESSSSLLTLSRPQKKKKSVGARA
ncbi:hypothetical protein PtA15_15A317 [Puccinia triticina]|uniref:Maf1 regulator n=1 Tax=Puccinia triticina TaxID=208348 RepID=A0ABY7D2T4_9BASI|nr:uncharacterized protein PtA15_15A317 [Puccinia triticina]WAQ91924.1 hypothetical protein PtA15_15A317 [Puccinia triticina]